MAKALIVMLKADMSGDYKVKLKQAVNDEQYPLPTTCDLYIEVAGTKVPPHQIYHVHMLS